MNGGPVMESECADDKPGVANGEHVGYLLAEPGVACGNETEPQCGKRASFDTELKISSLLLSAMEKFSLV